MAEPNPRCGKLDHGEVVGGELLVACGDASEMFDLVKETLNLVAQGREGIVRVAYHESDAGH